MTIGWGLRSRLDQRSDEALANRVAMEALWDEVAEQMTSVPTISGQRYVDRHRKRGKMLVRERIEALVDPTTPFLELSPLAGWGTDDAIGVGVAMGIGVVEGVECAVYGTDMTYKGGSVNPSTLTKLERLFEIARANRLPMISLSESAGADLPRQAHIFIRRGGPFRSPPQPPAPPPPPRAPPRPSPPPPRAGPRRRAGACRGCSSGPAGPRIGGARRW